MKKPTIKQLKKMSACRDGIEWYKSVQSKSIESIIDGANDVQSRFCNWYIARALSKENRIRYAIYAAEKVLHIFEEKYPNDDRPREAIQSAKDYLDGNISAAYAADAARTADAADATYAAYAAYAAAAAYAARAADATYATYAARAAAAYAADASYSYSDMLRDIVKYGVSLMEAK